PDAVDFTSGIVARRGCDELERSLMSARQWAGGISAEFVVVDNGLEDGCGGRLDELAASVEWLHVFHADHFLGAAAGLNVVLKQARGRHIVRLGPRVVVKADMLEPAVYLAD